MKCLNMPKMLCYVYISCLVWTFFIGFTFSFKLVAWSPDQNTVHDHRCKALSVWLNLSFQCNSIRWLPSCLIYYRGINSLDLAQRRRYFTWWWRLSPVSEMSQISAVDIVQKVDHCMDRHCHEHLEL